LLPTTFSGEVQGFGDTTYAKHHRKGTTDIIPGSDPPEKYPEMYNALGNLHSGWDVPMTPGTLLVALDDGIVVCVGSTCGQTAAAGGEGIGILYNSCTCVVFYLHTSDQFVADGDEVYAGKSVGESGTGNGYNHLHLEIRSCETCLTFYNPIYFFTPEALQSANITFMPYENNSNKWRIYGYSSYDNAGNPGYYWEGTIPAIWTK
jgi:murein DD-endopeptidase MepM/ murein hydrolase activator NlpD